MSIKEDDLMFNETVEKIKNSENVAGTAHTSAITNLDSYESAICEAKEEKE